MLLRTPADLGAVIRDRRKQLKLDQATLAKRLALAVPGSSRSNMAIRAPSSLGAAYSGCVDIRLDALTDRLSDQTSCVASRRYRRHCRQG